MAEAFEQEAERYSVAQRMIRSLPQLAVVAAIAAALAAYNYPYFRALVEIFSIVVSFSVVIVAWNGRRLLDNDYLLLVGFAYLFFSIINAPHLLSAHEFGLFPGFGPELTAQLYLIQRLIVAATFLAAPFFLRRRLPVLAAFLVMLAATVALVYSVLIARNFPVVFIPNVGFTAIGLAAELVIGAMFLGSAALLYRSRSLFDPGVLWMLISVMFAFTASELFFAASNATPGPLDLAGYLSQMLAFYLTYRAVVVTAYVQPYTLLFRQLAERERGTRAAQQDAQRRLDTTRLLLAAADSLASWTDIDELLSGLSRIVLEATGLGRVIITSWDPVGRRLVISSSTGRDPVEAGRVLTLDEVSSGVRKVVLSGETSIIDYDTLPAEERGRGPEFRMRLALDTPLLYGDSVLGFICVDVPGERHEFTEHEIEIVQGIASEAAVAIEHARLFGDLRQTEIRFRATFDSAAAAFVLADLNGAIVESNPAFNQMLGYESGEARGRPVSDFSSLEDSVRDDRMLRELLAGQRESYRLEKRYFRKDGSSLWGSLTASVVRDESKAPLFVIAVIEDITERKRAEDAAREKDRSIRQAYADVIDAVTGGKLILMTPEEVRGELGEVVLAPMGIGRPKDLADARRVLKQVLERQEPPPRVLDEYVLATCEAMTNAMKHGRDGEYAVYRTSDSIQIVVRDRGPGIDFATLPRATLLPGFSTQTSLGMGFTIMLDVADRVLLSTQPELTEVVLEVSLAKSRVVA